MAQSGSYLDRLGRPSHALAAVQEEADAVSGAKPATHAMPPPPARRGGYKPPAGKQSLQQQALLAAAAQSGARGPIGTVTDDPLGSAQDPLPSTSDRGAPEYSLSQWDQYFDNRLDLHLEDRQGTFRVYQAGTQGPVVFCLHGGGYSGLTWALLAKQLKGTESWHLIKEATERPRPHRIQTCQLRHLCIIVFHAQDANAVWSKLFSQEQPPVVLVGHSMGGAVAVRCAACKAIANVEGLVVIDVVEGTALSSLPHMTTVLRQRPASFDSQEVAVHWARRSGMSKNTEAACISLPSCLTEESVGTSGSRWAWRTPLHLSQPYWEGWYRGLSDLYMSVAAPKVLILAGTDRLDRALTVGQMQGKFQLVLLPQAGHAVHEDQSQQTSEVIANFIQRFRIGQPKMAIPKAAFSGPPVLPMAVGAVPQT